MYRFTVLVVFVTLLGGSIVQAASYEKTDGTIVGLIAISIPVTALNLADSPPFVNKLNNSTRRPSVFFA